MRRQGAQGRNGSSTAAIQVGTSRGAHRGGGGCLGGAPSLETFYLPTISKEGRTAVGQAVFRTDVDPDPGGDKLSNKTENCRYI